jgi:hypothetical protein
LMVPTLFYCRYEAAFGVAFRINHNRINGLENAKVSPVARKTPETYA